MTKKTLFLDFDGVLHRYTAPSNRLFVRIVHFERVMRQFPEWQIVISSSWREYVRLEVMRRRFSADIAERIVGVTPEFVARAKQAGVNPNDTDRLTSMQVLGVDPARPRPNRHDIDTGE